MPRLIRRRLHRGRDRSLGFTLLEILVVLALVGLLAAIVTPSWVRFSVNQSLNFAQSRAFRETNFHQEFGLDGRSHFRGNC
jgi:prepilin-type N-terminal cleavage/methylation domain-containing protein